jgi:signal transduction histidine kinase
MPKLSNKIKIILLIDLILFIACLIGIYQTYEKAGLEPNSHVSFNFSENKVVVNQVSDSDFRSVFSPGDQFIAIEGHPVSNKDDIEFIFDAFKVGAIVKITLERNGSQILQSLILPRYYSWLYLIVQIIVGCVFFINGVFVIYKRPEDLAANIWHWATICTAIIIMCTWGRFSITLFGIGHIIRDIFSTAYAFVSTLYLHLTYVFPRIKLKKANVLFKPFYMFSLILATWMIVTFELAAGYLSMDFFQYHLAAFNITRAYFAIVILWGMGNLIHSYFKAREQSEKRKIRWMLSGLAIGPPAFVIFWQIPQLLSFDNVIPEEIIVLIMIIVPVSFTISIVKYHIFDIDVILRRSSVYFITFSVILILYIAIVAIIAFFIGSVTLSTSILASVITAIIIPLVFEPARLKIQDFIDRKFFRIQYDYRIAQRNFTNELNNCMNLDTVTKMVIQKLDELLKPECIGLSLFNEDSRRWKSYERVNFETLSVNILKQLAKISERTQYKILSHNSSMEAAVEFIDLTKFNVPIDNISIIIPIVSQQKHIIGFLFCGKKKSELQYSLEDIDLLKTICSQTGLAIERIQLQKKLILQSEETQRLKELNQIKSLFVSNVSHEMQTPLTSIKMFSEILQSGKSIPESEQKEYLEIIEGESERLSKLIQNILDFSKIERGVMQYNFQICDMNEIITDVFNSIKYQLNQKNFLVKINLSNEPLQIRADPDAIKVVLFNLISNAIKYSDKEKYLSISSYMETTNTIVEISDKGSGISEEDQKHIFEAYYRAAENTQSIAGTGLGLTLVYNIMEAHGGNIEVKSTLVKGTTFRLIFSGESNA